MMVHPSINELIEKNEALTKELETLRIYLSEVETTNNHLVSATWRERDMKKKLADTIEELNATKLIVDAQNKRITESINYSRKIQIAINPTEKELKALFPKSFIFYLPKDVISGDFPWLYKLDKYVYVAAVDCTGHGVPGAMMSMIGNLLLNDIIHKGTALLPSEILHKLHEAVVNTLKQHLSESSSSDGMDIGLVRIDQTNGELLFSGAHRPLFVMRGKQIESYSGDKFPIGGTQHKGLNKYTDTRLTLEKSDKVILFSDGLPDQINGQTKKKLMAKGVKAFFEENTMFPMEELKYKLSIFFVDWYGGNKQIDDVLLMALEF